MYRFIAVLLLLAGGLLQAQDPEIYNEDPAQKVPLNYTKPDYQFIEATGSNFSEARVEPTCWWVGKAHPMVELLIYDKDIRDFE
ncbi:MAG: cyclomaltodextrinase N-terminal domain-containing protein, partial [Phaeodactylibacter sp.]|nr:cyclomaltodextrinase N-terminal domain-containing protein [Phaeodactylibacter sp.]